MRASGGRSNIGTRRSTGSNPKKLREPTTNHQQEASDDLAKHPSTYGGKARCPKGTFSTNNHRKRQQQRKYKTNIGTWNVTSLNGKEVEVVEEAQKYHLDILGISSTKRKGKGSITLNNGWQLYYSGVDTTTFAQAGVAILVNPRLIDSIIEWKPIDERVVLIRLQLKRTTATIIQIYAPNNEADYSTFLDVVFTTIENVPMTDSIFLIGDFNAHVGSDSQTWDGVIGPNGDQDINNQGKQLLDFCSNSGLSIMNTFFQHKNIHKYTWYKSGGQITQRSLIDFVITSDNIKRKVMDVRVKRGAELSTDHHLVVCIVQLTTNTPKQRTQAKNLCRIKWEALGDAEIKEKFAKTVDQKYSQLPTYEGDSELEWLLFRTAILGAAADTCGVKRIGSTNGQKRTAWWTEEIRKVVNQKKAAYKKWIQQPTSNNWQNYKQIRENVKKVVSEAKTKSWEDFGHQMESNYHTASKVFWQTIRRLRKGGLKQTRSIKNADGELLTSEEDILERWKQYFAELYNPTNNHGNTINQATSGDPNGITLGEVSLAIKSLKSGKAAGIDEIRPEMLKALKDGGIRWLTRICGVVWKSGEAPNDWQTGIVVPIFKKGDQRDCSNYRGITLLSLPGKVFARIIERRCRQIVEPQIQENQCGFRAGRSTVDQIFTLQQTIEKSWEYAKPIYALFIDLEKAYDRVPRNILWNVLKEYGIRNQLLSAIQSLYKNCQSCVRINGSKSDYFQVQVGLRQGCVLSPLLFVIYMDKISRTSASSTCVQIGNVKVDSLLFADDIARLATSENNLQMALNKFDKVCLDYGMKISEKKTEVMMISRDISFKYLGVQFSSDGRQEGEIDRRIGASSGVLRTLYRSVVTKTELSKKTKIAIFKSVYRPTLIYGHEHWVLTEKLRSRIQAAEMRFLRRISGLTIRDKIRSTNIRESLQVEPLLQHIERSQLRWLGHVIRMPHNRLPYQVFEAKPIGRRPVGRPRTSWRKYMEKLCLERLNLRWPAVQQAATDRIRWKQLLNALIPQPARTRGRR
ncbi:unnamed protein product [Adineta ricciae]|uniref:Reverse transcriptase domain-containing protein n=1 Tax=Adineta ricciae TaxID=249248 RepID=A0A815VU81_ADIRI|nr:unnamed protein product [Adineta ricciae]